MRKAILIFVLVATVLGGMATWFFLSEGEFYWQEIGMMTGLILVLAFAIILGIRRIRSVRKNQPPEDELSKNVMKRAASTAYYISLYSWLALMMFSDNFDLEVSTLIGIGIMFMAVEFALAWIYFSYFSKINE